MATKKSVSHPSKEECAVELEAIRGRLAGRRRDLLTTRNPGPFSTTDLADAEWLLCELDCHLGHPCHLTPSEHAELASLTEARRLTGPDQEALDRISMKHGVLTPDDLIIRDHLSAKQDAKLNADEQERYKELTEKSKTGQAATPAATPAKEEKAEHKK